MDNPEKLATFGTQDTHTHTKKKKKKKKKMSNTDPKKNRGCTWVLAKGKQFLLFVRRSPCYSYIQFSPVKV
jgi:hypothetical protein